MIYAGGTRNRLQLDKKEDLIRGLRMQKPPQSETMSGCSVLGGSSTKGNQKDAENGVVHFT